MKPLVIGHRGASAHRPEQTLAAFDLAFRLGADSVELDLLATRDGHLVCRHDLELSRTTDVALRMEFAHLRRTLDLEGTRTSGWFVHDFTLAELKSLRTRERWPRKRPGSASYDGRHPVATFAELLALVDAESGRQGRQLRVHAELKHPGFMEQVGLFLPDLIDHVRGSHVSWLSFDPVVLRRLRLRGRDNLVRNFDGLPGVRAVAEAAEYAAAIGVRRQAVLVGKGPEQRPTRLVPRAHRRGLDVLVWSHRAENKHLPRGLRIGSDAHAHGHGRVAAERLFEAGIDGLITDFPELGVAALANQPALPIAR